MGANTPNLGLYKPGDGEGVGGTPDNDWAPGVNANWDTIDAAIAALQDGGGSGYPASALVMYVSPTGDNVNDGLSPSTAVATIQHAYDTLRTWAEANLTPDPNVGGGLLAVGTIRLLRGDHDVGAGVLFDSLRPVHIIGARNGGNLYRSSPGAARIVSSSSAATEFIKITHAGSIVGYGFRFEDVAFRISNTTNTSLTKVIYVRGIDYAQVIRCSFEGTSGVESTVTAVYQESTGDSAWLRLEDCNCGHMQFYKAAVSPNGTNFNRGVIRNNVIFFNHATIPSIHFEGDWYSGLVEGNNHEGSACFVKAEANFADHNVFINNSGERPDNTNPVYWFTSGSINYNVIIGGRFTCVAAIGIFAQFDANAHSNTVIGDFSYTGTSGLSDKIVDNATAPGRNTVMNSDWGLVARYKSASGATISDSDFNTGAKVPNGALAVSHDTAGGGKNYIWTKVAGAWVKPDNDITLPAGVVGTAIRTSDRAAINNSATLVDDGVIQFALGASDHVDFKIKMLLSAANTTMDVKFGLTYPTGAAGQWGGIGTSASEWSSVVVGSSPAGTKSISQTLSYGTIDVGTAQTGIIIEGTIWGDGVHSGTVKLQLAQNTADANDLIAKQGSSIIYTTL